MPGGDKRADGKGAVLQALKGSRIVSAELNGRELVLQIVRDGEIAIKTYDMQSIPELPVKRLI